MCRLMVVVWVWLWAPPVGARHRRWCSRRNWRVQRRSAWAALALSRLGPATCVASRMRQEPASAAMNSVLAILHPPCRIRARDKRSYRLSLTAQPQALIVSARAVAAQPSRIPIAEWQAQGEPPAAARYGGPDGGKRRRTSGGRRAWICPPARERLRFGRAASRRWHQGHAGHS